MREIEFRGRDKRYDGTWEPWMYGSLDLSDLWPAIIENGPPLSVQRETVGQYTGLKDKNGVKIYEGDVLDVTACPDTRYIGVVVYNSHVASFEILFEEAEMGFPLQDDFDMEVVGNIFDDPELEKQFGEIYREAQ